MPFDAKLLARIAEIEEVEIVPKATAPVVVWVVVVGDAVYVRSVRGPEGRWYRRLARDRQGELRVGRSRVPVRARPATDEKTVAAVSQAFRRKYRGSPSLASMLRPRTLPTTLRLDPES